MKDRETEYELIKTYEDEKGTVRVFRPILTEEERNLRMKILKQATEAILKEQIKLGGLKNGY